MITLTAGEDCDLLGAPVFLRGRKQAPVNRQHFSSPGLTSSCTTKEWGLPLRGLGRASEQGMANQQAFAAYWRASSPSCGHTIPLGICRKETPGLSLLSFHIIPCTQRALPPRQHLAYLYTNAALTHEIGLFCVCPSSLSSSQIPEMSRKRKGMGQEQIPQGLLRFTLGKKA